MGKLLTYFYLTIAGYCVVSVFLTIASHQYQHTILSLFLLMFNVALFMIFRKEGRVPQLRLIKGYKR
ncbi:hypothetical protein [Mesobacillus zeae]|uniref:Uncharacterized protein n=1 Tax=Mesobacillus zeae TaxID=1917180 RepID=A0A398B9U3_9BACI|nr:hypothetical protein [Mesobacillus zeae]RID85618.1 hypothetical protein D1970_08670 [Mesobacillus zeae]